ncbi:guanine nucleotide-binding protein-like 3 isoform X1 [Takifugu rubripes]|uniref:Guanine nucleotide-binding protein-like 3 n=1 Tax=Takifugu rubripes TaxID=31033 RepID=H2SLS7_TAKRU|nr:guanine nucleotide-binding protein-like 3 isoform X1 [Takifugu rubripes]|eukprot:XP_003973683.1 PREDICTED: guanine nucleotide-binding protein-like 3 isoform X1 [Takifugu rubripes]
MKRPKLKKASKRMSCSKRYKIQKKVREHHKKLRKEAKKKGVSKRVKKDPGVPSIAPFKEEVLREAEQRRQQIEEEKQRNKEAKKEQRAQKRKQTKEPGSKETEPSAKKARQVERQKNSENQKAANRNSNKHLCSELNKVIDASDVVIEVLDARDPLGYRCPQLEEAVLQREGNKKLLLVLSKIDLVPKENLQKWIKCLQAEFPVVAFKSSAQLRTIKVQRSKRKRISVSNEILDQSRAATCAGNNCLTQILTRLAAKTKNGAPLKVGVVGFPNVGKSSLINILKGSLVCLSGVKKGTTRSMQEVNVSNTVKLLDSPGLIASPTNPQASMALRGLTAEEDTNAALEAVGCLLKQCDQTLITLQYNIPNFRNALEFLTMLAKKRGYLQKGGLPNTEQAATVFLADWTGPKLSYHCRGQDSHCPPAYVTDDVVSKMQDGWDLKALQKGNEETLKSVRFPNLSSSVTFTSKGPTAGLVNVSDIPKESPASTERELGQNGNNESKETSEEQNEEEKLKEPPKASVKKKTARVHFKPVPTDLSLASDDTYDFNTDFK